MKWTEETLKTKLRKETIQDDECATRGFEIATLLTGQSDIPPDPRPNSVETAMEIIRGALKEGGIVITWFESGYDEMNNPRQHCYFVFDDSPLQSFTVWADGPKFLDDGQTMQKLVATIRRDGEMGIHVYRRKG